MSGNLMVWGRNSHGQLGCTADVSSSSSGVNCLTNPTVYKHRHSKSVFAYVSCGELHTALLTTDGQVLAFGANQFGQLGRSSDVWSSLALPINLPDNTSMESILQLSCGRNHTLVLGLLGAGGRRQLNDDGGESMASTSVLAFGSSANGQLGSIDLSAALSDDADPDGPSTTAAAAALTEKRPKLVFGPWNLSSERSSNYCVTQIFSGGDHSFIFSLKLPLSDNIDNATSSIRDDRVWDPMSTRSIVTLCRERMNQFGRLLSAQPLPDAPGRGQTDTTTPMDDQTRQMLEDPCHFATLFSSLGCLAASCLASDHPRTSRQYCGCDLDAANTFQALLFQFLPAKQIYVIVQRLIFDVLAPSPSNLPHIECLRALLFILVSDLCRVPAPGPPRSRPPPSIMSCDAVSCSSSLLSNHFRLEGGAGLGQLRQILASKSLPSGADSIAELDQDAASVLAVAKIENPGIVLHAIAVAVNRLDSAPSKIMDNWLAQLRPRYFKRLILSLKNFITLTLTTDSQGDAREQSRTREEQFRSALELLKRLYIVNESTHKTFPYTLFQIPPIANHIDIASTFDHWVRQRETGRINFFSVCDYPFIFDTRTKAQLLRVEAQIRVMQASRRFLDRNPLLGALLPFGNAPTLFYQITVRRDRIVDDALNSLAAATNEDLRRPLRVKFQDEEAVDEGGVLKEFFMLTMRELLSPIYGMFRLYPESQKLWFSESCMEDSNVFNLVGILCGLTVYNSMIIDLSFPLAMYRKLLKEVPDLEDVKELDPVVGRSMQQLLDYEADDAEEVFGLTFTHSYDCFGEVITVDLVENGSNVAVTSFNKDSYVAKYVDHVFNKSCVNQYAAFENGVNLACGGPAISFFRPAELQSLVAGSDVVDWSELRKFTTYIGEYWDHHPVIEWFWDVFNNDFSTLDKKMFFRFLTGCDRISLFGFAMSQISIQPNKSGDHFLPVAHTCANMLDLPLYSSREILAKKLSLAILQTEGFGLV